MNKLIILLLALATAVYSVPQGNSNGNSNGNPGDNGNSGNNGNSNGDNGNSGNNGNSNGNSGGYNHLEVIQMFLNSQMLDEPLTTIATLQAPPGIFSPDVHGMLIPYGEALNLNDTLDLWYGSQPRATLGPLRHTGYFIRDYVEQGELASVSVDLFSGIPGQMPTVNLTFYGMFKFTGTHTQSTISYYNIAFTRIALYTRGLFGAEWTDPAIKPALIEATCGAHEAFCGNYRQYDDLDACRTFMNTIPFGAPDDLQNNNVLCRYIHANVAEMRPSVHCAHAGRTGGGMCVNGVYGQYYNEGLNPQLFGNDHQIPAVHL